MYQETGISIEPVIAGLMCSAIISDTLIFKSPTCTPDDIEAATELADIAGIDPEVYGRQMFGAGSNLDERQTEKYSIRILRSSQLMMLL